ncbi:MAG: phosphatidylethanolamine N-methyltransferase family protein [Anaerolineae bacterium]|nr:phosphatidylethanolamine N-methyltransferase family protein [Anaerolineae bacterium]
MLRQLASILILPFNAIIVIPAIIYIRCGQKPSSQLISPAQLTISRIVGILLMVIGLPLVVLTIRDFARIGRGTLAPWDPTQKLVVSGMYRYVRNPMISGVISTLFGIALIFNTFCHLAWAIIFTGGNMIYMPLSEEPGLLKRFGDDYRLYKQHVPRWLPRLTPWEQPPKG